MAKTKKYIKYTVIIALAVFSSFSLCSCYDDREMNELAYVIALGIDVSDGGGYNYTFQISNPIASGGGGEGSPSKEISNAENEEESEQNNQSNEEWDRTQIKESSNSGVMNIVVKAEDYLQAAELVNNIISKRINLSHLKVIVFSEGVCREGIDRHTRFLMNEREIRPGTNVVVAEKSAEYFLKNINPKLDMSTAKYYELLINNENMNYSQAVQLRELYNRGFGEDKVDIILPLGDVSNIKKSAEFSAQNAYENEKGANRLSGEKTELFGAAVINDMKMAGSIDGNAVKYYKLIMGELKDGAVFEYHNERAVVKNRKKSDIAVDTSESFPKISITLFIESENADNSEVLKKNIEDNIYMLLIKSSREYQADIFGFSNYAKTKFLSWEEFENYNWNEEYKNSVFSVNVNLTNPEFNLSRIMAE